ncbi:Tat pathway signal protein [Streptomyces sp. G7(2002)]|uniref:Tat pathway signal protein n=1 Tax=Streptomyces sp. G7(2002) TaxID=2971798 RepID=UPI003158203F
MDAVKAVKDHLQTEGRTMARTRNTLLASVIKETGWPQTQVAAHVVRVAAENGADELRSVSRSHIAMWISGTRPEGVATHILCETLSRRLGRVITPEQIGLAPAEPAPAMPSTWDLDTVTALVNLGDEDNMDMNRRQLLAATAYSAVGTALPPSGWWERAAEQARTRRPLTPFIVSSAHVDAVREAMAFYSRQDQRLGGQAGRSALIAYLKSDVTDYLSSRFASEEVRREFASAASELTYLAGWTAFDSSNHSKAQKAFRVAFHLAAEADDAPLAGHILRAAAHQAVDLGHPQRALELAEGSVERSRYHLATPRERALLGVVHARALAAARRKTEALAALRLAESDLSKAKGGGEEPARVFFFAEASLAHETAATLRDLGDLKGAESEFKRSVRTRALPLAARTHAVTLGYLGDVQVRQGQIDAACATWQQALDTMSGIQSGRAREVVVRMRQALSPVRGRGGSAAAELDRRARAMLRGIG